MKTVHSRDGADEEDTDSTRGCGSAVKDMNYRHVRYALCIPLNRAIFLGSEGPAEHSAKQSGFGERFRDGFKDRITKDGL